jgi:hypothetical protein
MLEICSITAAHFQFLSADAVGGALKAAFPVKIEENAGKACGKVEQFIESFSLAVGLVRK